jgi:2'-5' RNA ligase
MPAGCRTQIRKHINQMKRIFIALKVEAGVTLLNTISTLRSRLKNESIKWTNHENIHITLAFLGDTDEKNIEIVGKMLNKKCEGFGKFELTLEGTGVFRNYNDPRVLWLGIVPSEKLILLNGFIISGLRDSGINIEERHFNPHLTLARIKNINDKTSLKSVMEKYQDAEFQKVPVDEVILYESILQPTGPVYKPLGKFLL